MRSPFLLASSLVLMATAVPAVSAQNLVSNPGFETGSFSSWTPVGDQTFNGVTTGVYANSGTYGGFFGAVGTTGGIQQLLATTNGESYTLSFWLLYDGGTTGFFGAYWGGNEVDAMTNPGAFGYTQFSYSVAATSASTMLEFRFRNDPGFWGFDDVSVTAADSTVPEPATMTLLATGLAGLAAARKRRRTQA